MRLAYLPSVFFGHQCGGDTTDICALDWEKCLLERRLANALRPFIWHWLW
jgi:hypothetical protein